MKRGEFYINPRFLETWLVELEELNARKVGQPFLYPPSMIAFLAVLHAKSFDYRSLEGILRALSKRLGGFPVMSFSQIRRRILALEPTFKAKATELITGVDGTGMKVSNRGEWRREVWGDRRGWVKIVILGTAEGDIVDLLIGNEKYSERAAGRKLLRAHAKKIDLVAMDGLHDCKNTFDLCEELNIVPAIKIRKNASPKGLGPRPRAVQAYQREGYKQWARRRGYGLRWVATEGIFSAEKRIFGEELTSHKTKNLYHEAKLKFWAYQELRNHATA